MRQRVDGLEERLQLLSQQLEVPLVRWGWWHVITPMSWRKMEVIHKIHEIHLFSDLVSQDGKGKWTL
jgi:hypothetical protein